MPPVVREDYRGLDFLFAGLGQTKQTKMTKIKTLIGSALLWLAAISNSSAIVGCVTNIAFCPGLNIPCRLPNNGDYVRLDLYVSGSTNGCGQSCVCGLGVVPDGATNQSSGTFFVCGIYNNIFADYDEGYCCGASFDIATIAYQCSNGGTNKVTITLPPYCIGKSVSLYWSGLCCPSLNEHVYASIWASCINGSNNHGHKQLRLASPQDKPAKIDNAAAKRFFPPLQPIEIDSNVKGAIVVHDVDGSVTDIRLFSQDANGELVPYSR